MSDQPQDNKPQEEKPEGQPTPQDADWQKKAEEYLNSWKRAAADFENYKKRRIREDKELVAFAKQMSVVRILPVIGALEQALIHAPKEENFQGWTDGVKKILKEMEKALAEIGVEKIKTVGEKFNHELHEAVEMVEASGKSGEIIEELASGYKIDGHVLLPAKVKVAR